MCTVISLAMWALLPACERNVVEGTVYTQAGETLPGVVVSVQGTRFQAMSNARGEYKVGYTTSPVTLRYSKTGYAPGILELDTRQLGPLTAEDLKLWNVPTSHGVWLYENYRHKRTSPFEPERFKLATGETRFGITRAPDVQTESTEPFIVIYGQLPRYNVRLSRLELGEVTLEDLPDQTDTVWMAVGDVPVSAFPVDEPDGRLVQVRLIEPLQPGNYAVHWGALLEEAPLDSRAYVFAITPPPPPPGSEPVVIEGETPAEEAPAETPALPEPELPEDIPDEGPPDSELEEEPPLQ